MMPTYLNTPRSAQIAQLAEENRVLLARLAQMQAAADADTRGEERGRQEAEAQRRLASLLSEAADQAAARQSRAAVEAQAAHDAALRRGVEAARGEVLREAEDLLTAAVEEARREGQNLREIAILVRAGFQTREAVSLAASTLGRRTLKDVGLAAAGIPIEQDQPEIKRINVQHLVDQSSVGFVAAFDDI